MKIIRFLMLLSVVTLTACTNAQTQDTNQATAVKNVSAKDFKTIIEEGKGQLIDIRTPGEYNAGHIEGAVMIDFYAPDYKANLDKLDKNVPTYIYCRSGSRSSKTIGLMRQLGFKEIVNLQYGIIDWSRSGYGFVK